MNEMYRYLPEENLLMVGHTSRTMVENTFAVLMHEGISDDLIINLAISVLGASAETPSLTRAGALGDRILDFFISPAQAEERAALQVPHSQANETRTASTPSKRPPSPRRTPPSRPMQPANPNTSSAGYNGLMRADFGREMAIIQLKAKPNLNT